MSWDVALFELKQKPKSVDDIGDLVPLEMGSQEEVQLRISKALGNQVAWHNDGWGEYAGMGFTIEINPSGKGPVICVMLHVRGSGDAVGDIVKLMSSTGWHALDCTTSVFLDPATPSSSGWLAFQGYRDRIISKRQ